MVLNSFIFLVFFAIVFTLFWKIPRRFRWVLLLTASYYFYASAQLAYLGLIFLTTLINYYAALAIHHSRTRKKIYFFLTVFLNLSALFLFKYFNFFEVSLSQVTGLTLPEFKLLLPIGISFYTLAVLGYLIDVYTGKIKPEKHFGYFALFVSFFPHILAGPIARSQGLLPELKKNKTFAYPEVASGAKLFAIGLFKKMIIADNLGLIVDRVFGSLPEYKGISLIMTVFFYTWQIYMDFSGYTDMARGVAQMLGISLLENFRLPYLATSVRDFWRRWHISFSSWLKDYLYIPLGGNRKGLVRSIIATLVVFTVSGLWHGAAWHFVVWGMLHGIIISLERIGKLLIKKPLALPGIFRIAYTYTLVSIFWVFFRANSIPDALYVLRASLVGAKNFISPNYLMASMRHLFVFNTAEIVIAGGLLFLAIAAEIIQSKISFPKVFARQPVLIRFALYTLLVFLILELRNAKVQEFIYIRF